MARFLPIHSEFILHGGRTSTAVFGLTLHRSTLPRVQTFWFLVSLSPCRSQLVCAYTVYEPPMDGAVLACFASLGHASPHRVCQERQNMSGMARPWLKYFISWQGLLSSVTAKWLRKGMISQITKYINIFLINEKFTGWHIKIPAHDCYIGFLFRCHFCFYHEIFDWGKGEGYICNNFVYFNHGDDNISSFGFTPVDRSKLAASCPLAIVIRVLHQYKIIILIILEA